MTLFLMFLVSFYIYITWILMSLSKRKNTRLIVANKYTVNVADLAGFSHLAIAKLLKISRVIELVYRDRLSEKISVTPDLVWITAPNYDNSNPDFVVFTVRTTFEF